MVILINFGPQSLKVEYKNGNKTFVKQLPTNKFVAMKGLNVSEQISNKKFLATHSNVTIYDYERGTYFNRNAATPTGATMQFLFVGDNVKPGSLVPFAATGLTAGYNALKARM